MAEAKKIVIMQESSEMQEVKNYKLLDNGHISFIAVLQTVDSINRNTNYYPKDVLLEALAAPRIKDLVSRHAWFGEQSHPYQRKDFNRSVDILPDCITHRICQVPYLSGDKILSEIHTVEPRGGQLKSWIVDEGTRIGFSMRGLTPYSFEKTSPVAHKVIKSPMNIITYDAVFYPSHAEALMCMEDGREIAPATESVYMIDEIAKYFTEESSVYKIFRDELGIRIECSKGVHVDDKNHVSATLNDGRLIQLEEDENLLLELSQYLYC